MAKEGFRVGAVLGRHRDSDARRDLDRQAVDHERPVERAEHALAHLARKGSVGIGNQQAELGPAQARDAVRVAECVTQPAGEVAHDVVALWGPSVFVISRNLSSARMRSASGRPA